MEKEKTLTLKTLTKGMAWELQENDIFRLIKMEKGAELKENFRHYTDIIRCAFEIEEVKVDKPEVLKKIEARGFKIDTVVLSDDEKDPVKFKMAIKKRPIQRITDLTYENIRHISTAKLLEVIDRNFGGGWDSLSQSIKDIIESSFDISTTTLPKDRLHNPGGMYETKVADGFDVLQISKGNWVEAIFAKAKPMQEKHINIDDNAKSRKFNDEDDEEIEIIDDYNNPDEDDQLDEEMLEEESYRTTFETEESDLTLDDVDATDEDF